MSCLVIGDSIAVGIASQMPECIAVAKIGLAANAIDVIATKLPQADLTVISVGSNAGPDDESHMRSIRAKLGGRAVWVLPAARMRETVRQIAREHGDNIIDTREAGATPLHIHPDAAGYSALAFMAKAEGQPP